MTIEKSKIAILSTVINWELYRKSSQYFPAGIKRYVIDGSDGMFGLDSIFYMMKKFEYLDFDWLIMADEDVLFLNPNGIYETINHMNENNFMVCGIRDGGVIPNRTYSPYLINTFFSIINLKKLKSIWNKNEIIKNNYISDSEFGENLSILPEKFDVKSLYEPYYCFYFWLRRKGESILFLDSEAPFEDRITTLVFTPKKHKFIYHTWYARSYGSNEKHTKRIDTVFELLSFDDSKYEEPIIWKDEFFFVKRFLRKQKRKVIMKLEKFLK
jgi:hypothetical protein